MIDWTDDEFDTAVRIATAKAAHDRSEVFVPTTIEDARQRGFDFLRDEFRVHCP